MIKKVCLFCFAISFLLILSSCAYNSNYEIMKENADKKEIDLEKNVNSTEIDGYYLNDDTFVRENVTLNSQTTVKRSSYTQPIDHSGAEKYLFFRMGQTERQNAIMAYATPVVARKVGSVSYYKTDENGYIYAYTVSDLEITSLLTDESELNVGDSIKAVESYAFSPEKPDEVFISATWASFHNNQISGIMESGKEYVILLWSTGESFLNPFLFADGTSVHSMRLSEDLYVVSGDIYPAWDGAYDEIADGCFYDLCLPSENAMESWKYHYLSMWNLYFNKTGDV